jgi:hypothetical protein
LITHNTMNFLIREYPLHDGVSRDVLDIFALGVEEEMVGELNRHGQLVPKYIHQCCLVSYVFCNAGCRSSHRGPPCRNEMLDMTSFIASARIA